VSDYTRRSVFRYYELKTNLSKEKKGFIIVSVPFRNALKKFSIFKIPFINLILHCRKFKIPLVSFTREFTIQHCIVMIKTCFFLTLLTFKRMQQTHKSLAVCLQETCVTSDPFRFCGNLNLKRD
jgi:hypothetical protein